MGVRRTSDRSLILRFVLLVFLSFNFSVVRIGRNRRNKDFSCTFLWSGVMEIIADENAIHFKTSAKIRTTSALAKFLLPAAVVLLVCALTARAAVSDGSISGTLKDPTGALIPDATIIL